MKEAASSQNLRMLLEEPNFDHAVNNNDLVKQKQLELDSLTDQFGRASQKFLQELEHSIDTCEIEGLSGNAVQVEKDLVNGHVRKRTIKMVMKRRASDGPQSVTTLSQEAQVQPNPVESTLRLKQTMSCDAMRVPGKNGPRKKRTIRRNAGQISKEFVAFSARRCSGVKLQLSCICATSTKQGLSKTLSATRELVCVMVFCLQRVAKRSG
jgi:hypothetical protein